MWHIWSAEGFSKGLTSTWPSLLQDVLARCSVGYPYRGWGLVGDEPHLLCFTLTAPCGSYHSFLFEVDWLLQSYFQRCRFATMVPQNGGPSIVIGDKTCQLKPLINVAQPNVLIPDMDWTQSYCGAPGCILEPEWCPQFKLFQFQYFQCYIKLFMGTLECPQALYIECWHL